MDPRTASLANIIVNYSLQLQPDEWVVLMGDPATLPLTREIYRFALRAGALPSVYFRSDELREIFLLEANEKQLSWISPFERAGYEEADAFVSILGTSNTRALTNTDPKNQQRMARARTEMYRIYADRTANTSFRFLVALCPTNAGAQDADMSLPAYEDFVYAATFADQPDPIQRWETFRDRQERLLQWLEGKREVVVRGPNIDLTLSVEGRTFMNSCGRLNMPDGEIYTGPVEETVNGWVRFNYPANREGREVEGVEFTFEQGKVVKASAKKNEAYLLAQLDADAGARYLGEFAIGTNYAIDRFTKSILFDEKIGGTLHMAIGYGFPETGSKNRSSIHWDFICDMQTDSEILIDGELFYRDGAFVVK